MVAERKVGTTSENPGIAACSTATEKANTSSFVRTSMVSPNSTVSADSLSGIMRGAASQVVS